MSSVSRQNKQALDIPDDTKQILTKRVEEKIFLEENSTRVWKKTLGESWIVGSSINGIVGTNTGTQSGNQQVVGGSGRVTTISSVVNPNNIYREHFRDTTFKGYPRTANWDVTNFRLAMHTSSNHAKAYNTIMESASIALNDGTVSKATFTAVEKKWNSNDQIKYYLSANGGNNWEEISLGVEHIFTYRGSDLRFRVIFIGNGGKDTYVEELRIVYG